MSMDYPLRTAQQFYFRNDKETEAEKVDQLTCGHKVLQGCSRARSV